ncbi:hypothetical protein [[Muricauda] lutisoli]|uniref:Uncharacterized protein n=1 Tax=[Muricauda] lutisoli TaxID=2816035 RepID=A0ABS3EUD2_9FLAO|nr:hypothetical protein [[Muricauda] lutisoli]MBO0329747.1 hypothetical protein [[Muricauda] lutisoli]
MKDFLNNSIRRYHLKLGKYEFSPVVQLSTSISLDYFEAVKNSDTSSPLILTFPSKHNAALWLSSLLLINKFFYDCVSKSDNRIKKLGLKAGDKIDIFSSTAIFKGINPNDELVISFSDGASAYIDIQNAQFVNSARKNMVNKFAHFVKKKRSFLRQRKAITQILNLHLNPNLDALESKIILISGRGKVGSFRRTLKDTELYDESLADTVLLDKNLIISPDLSYFDGIQDKSVSTNESFFTSAMTSILNSIQSDDSDLRKDIEYLLTIAETELRTRVFVEALTKLINDLSEEDDLLVFGNKLKGLFSHYPGIEENILESVDAVIINEIQQLNEYPETIGTILTNKIPVIIISDRVITEFKEFDLYKNLFNSETYRECFRFNWDKIKLDLLNLQRDNRERFIDFHLNNLCVNSINQEVKIIEFESGEFDSIYQIFESKDLLGQLNDFELLQKAYYQILRPILYVVKNSSQRIDTTEIIESLNAFEKIFKESSAGLNEAIKERIFEGLSGFKKYVLTGKEPKPHKEVDDSYFFQNILINDHKCTIPEERDESLVRHYNDIDESEESITFFGYPYRDYYFKFLARSCFNFIIPKLKLYLNECESSVTKNFLISKFKAGYFVESLPNTVEGLESYLITSQEEVDDLIADIFSSDKEIIQGNDEEMIEFDNFEKLLNDIRYSEFKTSNSNGESDGAYILKCDVLHFNDGGYLFMPHKRRILLLRESQTHEMKSEYALVDNISIGDIAVDLNVSRRSISDYLEDSGAIRNDLDKLDVWRNVLISEFEKYQDIHRLMDSLSQANDDFDIGGSPEIYNVARWLHDDSLLSPNEENLRMILSIHYNQEDIPQLVDEIVRSRRIIIKAKNKLNRTVKERLSKLMTDSYSELENEFTVAINGINVAGRKAEIVGIEKRNDLSVEYHSTMKFIYD